LVKEAGSKISIGYMEVRTAAGPQARLLAWAQGEPLNNSAQLCASSFRACRARRRTQRMASPFQVRQRRYTARKAAPYGDCRKALTRCRQVLTEPAMPATRLRDSELPCNPERAPGY